jgi:sugar lactone lactonase YvrE
MRRIALFVTATALLVTAAVGSAAPVFPESIALPNGWRPEGIAIAPGGTLYVGSLANGAVWGGSLRTGDGAPVVPAQSGRVAVGVDENRGRLFVAGGPAGDGYVYDAKTGAPIASYDFASAPTFINDVVVTRTAAWFTDSSNAVLYKVSLGAGGAPGATFEIVPLSGDFVLVPGEFNANGIDATPSGKTLVIVNSEVGALYTVDPETGDADEIELTGGDAASGDGILLDGKTLYVVKNFQNRIAVVALDSGLSSGTVVTHIMDSRFDIPTTIDEFGKWLYVVNARFTTPPTPSTAYTIVQVPKA